MGHGALLVALQLFLIGEIGKIRSVAAVYISFGERSVGEMVEISVLVPVYIKCQHIGFVELPTAARTQRGIMILHVVGAHIHPGMLARRPVDAFPIEAAAGIELHALHGRIGKALADLPVGVAVHGFVARVVDGELCLMRVFGGGILPAVAMLGLKIGPAAPSSPVESEAVVLTNVTMTAHAGRVFEQQAFLAVLLGDDVDDTGNGIAAVERTRGALHYLDALDVVRVDQPKVVLSAHIAMQTFAVNHDQDITISKTIHLHLGAHVVRIKCKRAAQHAQNVFDALTRKVTKHASADDLGLHRSIFQQMLRTCTRHHHFG